MPIATLDGLIGAPRQLSPFFKTASVAATAATPTSVFDQAGAPPAGSLNPGNTTNGIVPTDATLGALLLNDFGVGAEGVLTRVGFTNTVPCSMMLYDRLFSVGNITMTTAPVTTTLSAQPSYSGRLPLLGGLPDFTGLEIWLETGGTALSNHAHTVQVNYQNDADQAVNTGAISTTNLASRRMFRFPLSTTGKGVKRIDSVVANGVASAAGNFNIHVMRPLWMNRVGAANAGGTDGPERTMLPRIFQDSSLFLIVQPDGTATGLPYLSLTVSNG